MSKFTIKTSKLQSMLNKAIKCSGNGATNVLTAMVHVELENNVLRLTTTDINNYLTIIANDIAGDDISFTVSVEKFSKLVSKTSTEEVSISVNDEYISITGNGTYKIPLQFDVNGEQIRYPNHEINTPDESGTIKVSTIKNIILHNKPELAVTDEEPCLTGYFCTDECTASADTFNICRNDVALFKTDLLVQPLVFDLLSMSLDDEISYKLSDNDILFESASIKLFSHLMEGKEKYSKLMTVVNDCAETEYVSTCVLPKTALLNVIDRLSLFIGDNDENGVYMTFTKNGVKVETINGSAIESIPYQSSDNFKDFRCLIGVDSLKRQLSSVVGEAVNVHYGGTQKTVTIKQDNATHIISLLKDGKAD